MNETIRRIGSDTDAINRKLDLIMGSLGIDNDEHERRSHTRYNYGRREQSPRRVKRVRSPSVDNFRQQSPVRERSRSPFRYEKRQQQQSPLREQSPAREQEPQQQQQQQLYNIQDEGTGVCVSGPGMEGMTKDKLDTIFSEYGPCKAFVPWSFGSRVISRVEFENVESHNKCLADADYILGAHNLTCRHYHEKNNRTNKNNNNSKR